METTAKLVAATLGLASAVGAGYLLGADSGERETAPTAEAAPAQVSAPPAGDVLERATPECRAMIARQMGSVDLACERVAVTLDSEPGQGWLCNGGYVSSAAQKCLDEAAAQR